MKRFLLTLALLGTFGGAANALPNAAEIIPTKNGAIRITPIYHGSLQIEYRGLIVYVDPFSGGNYSGAKKADLVLITHSHPDHFDPKAIDAVIKPSTAFAVPFAVDKALETALAKYKRPLMILDMENGHDVDLAPVNDSQKLNVRAVPAYNLKRGPKPGQKFHPKGQGNGYILTLGGKRIYIAGDTEATPEMKALKNIDIAFLPMNLPYTMTPQEAAIGAQAFKPKVVYPYHYRYPFDKKNDNPQQFARALAGSGIQVKLRDWYGHPAKK